MNADDVNNNYAELNTLCRQNDRSVLEDHFYKLAIDLSGEELANQIRSIDVSTYTLNLHNFLYEECLRLSHHAVKALYFEYNLDHSWDSHLLICDRYSRISQMDETWTRHWIEKIAGPGMHEFALFFKDHGGLRLKHPREIGVSFYLIARTAAAYMKAVFDIPTHKMAVCIGHNNQRRITRIFE